MSLQYSLLETKLNLLGIPNVIKSNRLSNLYVNLCILVTLFCVACRCNDATNTYYVLRNTYYGVWSYYVPLYSVHKVGLCSSKQSCIQRCRVNVLLRSTTVLPCGRYKTGWSPFVSLLVLSFHDFIQHLAYNNSQELQDYLPLLFRQIWKLKGHSPWIF